MRFSPLALAVGLVASGAAGCSDDAEAPPVTGTEEAFCTELRTAVTEHVTIFDPLAPTSADDTRAATARLADAAPAEVAEDMGLLADTFADVADVLDEHDPGDPDAAAALEDLDIDEVAIADAQEAVSAYSLDACGVDLAAINSASVTATSQPAATTLPPPTSTVTTVPPVQTTAPPTTG
jgi:hypothetical protein